MIYFLIFFVILLAALQQFSINRDMSRLEISMDTDKRIVEPGEGFDLLLEITNPDWLIYPYFKVDLNLPPEFELETNRRFTSFMMPKQTLRMRIPAVINKRGRFISQNLTLYAGDFLGTDDSPFPFPCYVDIVCLPKAAEEAQLEQMPGGLYGELSVNRFVFEDPILTLGFREYTGREPMKQISWPASARMGRLMAKQYDYTEDASVLIAVNGQAKTDGENFERCYSMARSIIEKLEDMGIQYSFCTNSITAGDINSWGYVSSGLGRPHMMHILEGLGRCTYRYSVTTEKMLSQSLAHGTNNFALIFLTPGDEPDMIRSARQIASHYGVRFYSIKTEAAAEEAEGSEPEIREAAK